jgi:hypothetical protein
MYGTYRAVARASFKMVDAAIAGDSRSHGSCAFDAASSWHLGLIGKERVACNGLAGA